MAILQECPICRKRYKLSKNKCPCGENLHSARQGERVKYHVTYRLPSGKLKREPGERIVLLDSKGARFQAVIKEVGGHHVLVNLEKPLSAPAPSPVHMTLCQSLLKSQRMDLLVEKTSELG